MEGGAVMGADLLFGIIFSENCIKMKKKWTKRGRTSLVSPVSAIDRGLFTPSVSVDSHFET